jgi:hypothetical protein
VDKNANASLADVIAGMEELVSTLKGCQYDSGSPDFTETHDVPFDVFQFRSQVRKSIVGP